MKLITLVLTLSFLTISASHAQPRVATNRMQGGPIQAIPPPKPSLPPKPIVPVKPASGANAGALGLPAQK